MLVELYYVVMVLNRFHAIVEAQNFILQEPWEGLLCSPSHCCAVLKKDILGTAGYCATLKANFSVSYLISKS